MRKFRMRLTLLFILLIGISVLGAGILAATMLQRSHINELKESMHRELSLLIATVDWKTGGSEADLLAYYTNKAVELKRSANIRVTFIRQDGTVLGDSDHDPATMDNHGSRGEIIEAGNKGVGSTIRYSDTIKRNMLYVAVPVRDESGIVGYIRLAMSLEQVEASIRYLWFFLITGLFIVFVLAAIISYRVAYGLTGPLEKITNVANQIAHLNYRSRVHIGNKDEIGQLGQAINAMADSLQLQLNQILEDENRLKSVLEHMTSGVVMIDRKGKIALLNRSAEEILGFASPELLGKKFKEAKLHHEFAHMIQECMEHKEHLSREMNLYFPVERILEVNVGPMRQTSREWEGVLIVLQDITAIRRLEKMRSEFVANVSHELKTPVAAVKGFAETLLAGALNDPETAKSFLQIIYDESERLNRLINDILELSKIETKGIPLHFSAVHLTNFIGQSLDMMRPEANKKRIQLEMHVDEQMVIEADEDRLRQILINLLSNGIKYTPEGGKVKVIVEPIEANAAADDEKIRIIVSDNGIGIPKKDLSRIFERFYRVDKARSRMSGGTGLGLSIVKHLVELHKGTIRAESEIGMGTRIIMELPVIH